MLKITFLQAENGTVVLSTADGQFVVITNEEEAKVLQGADLSDCYASSSMDFASEYGFNDDMDAWKLINGETV